MIDRDAANVAAKRGLREVANARIHATTGEIRAERLEEKRGALRPLPSPYAGRIMRRPERRTRPAPRSLIGMQHPLSTYEILVGASL